MKTFTWACRLSTFAMLVVVQAHPSWSSSPEVEAGLERCSSLDCLVTARHAWESWQWEQLSYLQERGHATWIELDQQRVVRDAWGARQQAVSRLHRYLHDLAQQTTNGADIVDEEMIRFGLPGSIRLAAWLRVSDVPLEMLSDYVGTQRNGVVEGELESLRDIVTKKCEEAANEYDVLHKISAEDEKLRRDRERARLRLQLARAEVAWIDQAIRQEEVSEGRLRRLTRVFETRKGALRTQPVSQTPGVDSLVTASADERLLALTSRVAELESRNLEVRVVEIAHQIAQDQVDAIRDLHQQGAASLEELNAVEAHRQTAASACEAARANAQRLRRLSLSTDGDRSTLGSREDARYPGTAKRDADGLKHAAVLRYLIDLRFQLAEAEADRDTMEARTAHLDELTHRLKAAHDRANLSEHDSTVDAGYHVARTQELNQVHARRELTTAQHAAAKNRCEALAVEEKRFLAQLENQLRDDVDSPAADGSGETRQVAAWSSLGLRLANYVEAPDRLGIELVPLEGSTRPHPSLVAESHLRHVSRRRFRFIPRAVVRNRKDIGEFYNFQTNSMTNSLCRFLDERPGPCYDRRSWRIPSYSQYYAFGIRRADLCSPRSQFGRATPYGGPWYFPGAPTNYR